EASGGRYICGFWGYYSNGFNAATYIPGKVHHNGYCGFQKVLESPDIDYICVLQAYANVRWGTPMVPITLTESIRQHGKMCLIEYDVRTFFSLVQFTERTYSQPETIAVLKRDIYSAALRGYPLWWVGFASGTAGRVSVPWYAEDSILETLRDGNKIYQAAYKVKGSRSCSEVAAFMNNADVYTLDVMGAHQILSSAQYNPAYFELTKLGAPIDYYHLDDIGLERMDQYKVYVFLNAYNLTKEQREIIRVKVTRAGKTAVWLYAPGFSDGTRLSCDYIKELTGFEVDYDKEKLLPEVKFETGRKLTAGFAESETIMPRAWGNDPVKFEFGPIFYIKDASAEALGRYSHNEKVAYAVKKTGEGTSVYLAIPYIDSAVLRNICRSAGVHLYSQNGLFLDASENFILITSAKEGYKGEIKLPRKATVYDIGGKKVIGDNVNEFIPVIPPFETGFYFVGGKDEVDAFVKGL
ncbi:MAG: hypothetical protein HY350_03715, partial [Candidatus Omnitrophica bacterium]|nr:hypothetical protein [Candidatus Omnitrophota bacterium]